MTEIDLQTDNTLMVSKQEGQEGKNTSLGLADTCYYRQVNNKDLLFSTGNYAQYLVKTSKGKESEK